MCWGRVSVLYFLMGFNFVKVGGRDVEKNNLRTKGKSEREKWAKSWMGWDCVCVFILARYSWVIFLRFIGGKLRVG